MKASSRERRRWTRNYLVCRSVDASWMFHLLDCILGRGKKDGNSREFIPIRSYVPSNFPYTLSSLLARPVLVQWGKLRRFHKAQSNKDSLLNVDKDEIDQKLLSQENRTCLRDEMTTEAPSRPNRSAIPNPIPAEEAVTTATLPSSRRGIFILPIPVTHSRQRMIARKF